jgi:hypothetical protein
VERIHPRPLSADEERVLRHLLGAWPGGEPYLQQLEHVRVTGRCHCGCVTVHMDDERGSKRHEPEQVLPVEGGLSFETGDAIGGVLIFTRNGRLSALEAYSIADAAVLTWPPNDRIAVQLRHV